jgi:hypothetical protein
MVLSLSFVWTTELRRSTLTRDLPTHTDPKRPLAILTIAWCDASMDSGAVRQWAVYLYQLVIVD